MFGQEQHSDKPSREIYVPPCWEGFFSPLEVGFNHRIRLQEKKNGKSGSLWLPSIFMLVVCLITGSNPYTDYFFPLNLIYLSFFSLSTPTHIWE